jgi:hypothetical protein
MRKSGLLGAALAALAFAVPAQAAPLQISITADQPVVEPSAPNGYSVTISNPNATAATLTEYHQHLADHGHGAAKAGATTTSAARTDGGVHATIGNSPFTYTPGTTTGFTTADPLVQNTLELYWRGAWAIPANGSISLHFGVRSAGMAAIFYTRADGKADGGINVPLVKKQAPITVAHGGPVSLTVTADEGRSCQHASNGYSVRIDNSGDTAYSFAQLRAGMASGFRYLPGTTTGFVNSDPRIGNGGQILRWIGPYSVPAHGALTMHFGVDVGTQTGSGLVRLRLEPVAGGTVIGTGPVAPVRVVSC